MAVLALLACAVALGLWMETRENLAHFGAVSVIIAAAIMRGTGVLPDSSVIYAAVSSYGVLLSIPMLLFGANLRRIWLESGRMVLAFLAAAVATVVGAVLAFRLVPLGDDASAWASIIATGSIGGGANQAAVAFALDKSDDPFLAVLLTSIYAVAVPFMSFMLLLPGIPWLWRVFSPVQRKEPVSSGFGDAEGVGGGLSQITAASLALSLAVSASICAVSSVLASVIGAQGYAVLFITAITVVIATFAPDSAVRAVQGHYNLGQILIYLFFATIGAQIDFSLLSADNLIIVAFVTLLFIVHLCVLSVIGRFANFSGAELSVASVACIFGPAPAAALSVSRKWSELTTPAILCGVLGYAIANPIGLALHRLLS